MEDEGITFRAYFSRASTLIDGGWRISFDLLKHNGPIASKIASLQGKSLQIAVIPLEDDEDALESLIHG